VRHHCWQAKPLCCINKQTYLFRLPWSSVTGYSTASWCRKHTNCVIHKLRQCKFYFRDFWWQLLHSFYFSYLCFRLSYPKFAVLDISYILTLSSYIYIVIYFHFDLYPFLRLFENFGVNIKNENISVTHYIWLNLPNYSISIAESCCDINTFYKRCFSS